MLRLLRMSQLRLRLLRISRLRLGTVIIPLPLGFNWRINRLRLGLSDSFGLILIWLRLIIRLKLGS